MFLFFLKEEIINLFFFSVNLLNWLGVFLSVKTPKEEKGRKKGGGRIYLFNFKFIS